MGGGLSFKFIEGNFFEPDLINEQFDAVMSLDVIEHIEPKMEDRFCEVVTDCLTDEGVAIIGTPNITLSPYASEPSRIAHINLYDQKRLYDLMSRYFDNVFIFNMNDEVINTSFAPMACYIFAVGAGKKAASSKPGMPLK